VRQYPDGEHVILATEGPYYVIGELSMLVNQPRTGAVVAVSDCTLIALQRQAFVDVCAEIPDVSFKVLAQVGARLYRLNLQVRENAIGNVAARVASVLLLLAGGQNGPVAQPVRVSRVARAAATDADVVERLLTQWKQQQYITFDGQQVTILDAEMLQNIAG
jgi:CRP-like cAMP-binding protein